MLWQMSDMVRCRGQVLHKFLC